MVVNDTRIYQKIKSKNLLSIEKNIIHEKKRFVIIIRANDFET